MSFVIELFDQFPFARVVIVFESQFVKQAPHHDRGVIEILLDQLAQLLFGVVIKRGCVIDLVDQSKFSPDHQAVLVAEVIEIIRVLIVSEADRIGPHFQNEGHVLIMLCLADGPSHIQSILVAVDAVERIRMAIKKKSALGIDMEITEPQGLRDLVNFFAVA